MSRIVDILTFMSMTSFMNVLLMDVKMPAMFGVLTFMSMTSFMNV